MSVPGLHRPRGHGVEWGSGQTRGPQVKGLACLYQEAPGREHRGEATWPGPEDDDDGEGVGGVTTDVADSAGGRSVVLVEAMRAELPFFQTASAALGKANPMTACQLSFSTT